MSENGEKKFILERNLLHPRHEENMSKEELELYDRLKVFMRFQSKEEHEALVNGLVTELRIRKRIEELQEYRAAGCHTLAEAEQYAAGKKKRETEASSKKSKESGQLFATAKVGQRANRSVNRERGEGDSSPGSMVENQKAKGIGGQAASGNSACPVTTGQQGLKKSLPRWDISSLPGTDLLSLPEQQLCTQNRLFPAHYLKMKEVLIYQDIRNHPHPVKRSDAYRFFKIDHSVVDKVYDFLLRMGLIHEKESATH
uniref:SWIRM domain-containing protein n=1 Tax=Araucaria cunninghamii TaxID=56994 RepID=A0A0D6R1B1_ARACU